MNAVKLDALQFVSKLLNMKDGQFQEHNLPQPSSLLRADLPVLSHTEYYVAPKHDGVRHLLLMGWCEDTDYTALITRGGHVTLLPYKSIEGKDHQGTLFDGELMNDHTFVIFDAYAASGYDVKSCDLSDRLKAVEPHTARMQSVAINEGYLLPIPSIKHFEIATSNSVKDAWVTGCQPGSDGIILAPRFQQVKLGRLATYYKLKPKDQHTIDLMYEPKEKDGSVLKCARGEVLPFAVDVNTVETNAAKRGVIEVKLIDASSFACKLAPGKTVALSFVQNRPDKSVPNSRFVVDRTIINVLENVQISDVQASIS